MDIQLTPDALSMLRAVVALCAWTLVMALWMMASRLPAMRKAGIQPQDAAHTAHLRDRLPSESIRVSDNYNHLFEAPTVFYAIALAVVALGLSDPTHALFAWIYVGARVLHSLVQATFNRVMVRFTLFLVSWIAAAVIIVRTALAVFQ